MIEGDIGLAALPQNDGQVKLRPVLLLKEIPGFGDFMVCGITTQFRYELKGLDAVLVPDSRNNLKKNFSN